MIKLNYNNFRNAILVLAIAVLTFQLAGCNRKAAPTSTNKKVSKKRFKCNCGKPKKTAFYYYQSNIHKQLVRIS